jgi:Ca2+-binding RTX toxin-like protein
MRHRTANAKATSIALTAIGLLALVPAGALASTANTRIQRVWYTAAPGEVNNLTISLPGADYSLSDPGAAITAMPACTALGSTATCPGAGIRGITVNVADGADSIVNTTATSSTLSGGDGNDSLEGGTGDDILRGNNGVDTHTGGLGNDFIDSRGDRGDIVSCGEGMDTARADVADSVAPDCETIDRGILPPPPPVDPGAPPPSPTAEALIGPTEARTLDPGACSQDMLGTASSDRLAGSGFGDNLFGLQGNDVLRGGSGDDCLFGGTGHDRMSGAGGDDRLLGDDSGKGVGGNDRLSGNAGNDMLSGGPGNDRLKAGAGRNRLRGGLGNDRLHAVNSSVDRLSCGRGNDVARADRADRLSGCERVRRRR